MPETDLSKIKDHQEQRTAWPLSAGLLEYQGILTYKLSALSVNNKYAAFVASVVKQAVVYLFGQFVHVGLIGYVIAGYDDILNDEEAL